MIFTTPSRFRWVFCQLEALRYCFPPSVWHLLEELPESLDETYERILKDINKANRAHAHRLLQCLTVAVRPLRVSELAEVLAVDFGMASRGGMSKLNTDWRWEDQQHAILSTCPSFISVLDEDCQVVQFSHFSVKEFLTSSRLSDACADVSRFHILFDPAHTILAKACLGVLLRLEEYVDGDNVEKKFPLARYAAEHWVDHVQLKNVPSDIRQGMGYLFDPDKPYFAAWLQVHDIDTPPPDPSALYHFAALSKEINEATPLYYAAFCGFYDLAEQLIMKHPQQINAHCGYYVSPLGAALGRGHLDVAQLLHEHGADVDVRGAIRRTPLIAAVSQGHCDIAEWLLSHGADPNLHSDVECFTALHMAAWHGQLEVCQILLQYKADHNSLDRDGQTPLHRASYRGHANVALLLLERGVDVNAQDNNCTTALHLASGEMHIGVARLLLEHGVDVNAKDGNGRTPFHIASLGGEPEISRILLEHKTDQNGPDNDGRTPLHLASRRGHIDVVRLLLERDVGVNVKDNNRSTALHLASRGGRLEVACLLIEHGADLEVEDDRGRTPLQVASGLRRDEVTKLLSERLSELRMLKKYEQSSIVKM